MRTLLTAALAVLALAAPAAAQPDAGMLMRQAMERLAANEGENVRDYSLSIVHEDQRTPVYVARDGTGWEVRMPGEVPLGDFMEMAVFWPLFSSSAAQADGMGHLEGAEYVREESVGGRRAHALTFAPDGEMLGQELDSVLIYVDARTRQLLRVSLITRVPGGMQGFGDDTQLAITIDAAEHRETDGLTIPRQLRVRMRLKAQDVDRDAVQAMRDQMAAVLAELEGSSQPEAAEMMVMLRTFAQLLSDEGMDLRLAVEDVRVNPGPPEWLDETDF
jgi:hypothetical protein